MSASRQRHFSWWRNQFPAGARLIHLFTLTENADNAFGSGYGGLRGLPHKPREKALTPPILKSEAKRVPFSLACSSQPRCGQGRRGNPPVLLGYRKSIAAAHGPTLPTPRTGGKVQATNRYAILKPIETIAYPPKLTLQTGFSKVFGRSSYG